MLLNKSNLWFTLALLGSLVRPSLSLSNLNQCSALTRDVHGVNTTKLSSLVASRLSANTNLNSRI